MPAAMPKQVPRALRPPRVVNIEDLRRLAKRRLPAAVFDYLDGGAEGEVTLRENCAAFEAVKFRPRQAVGSALCDLRATVWGLNFPFRQFSRRLGYSRMMHAEGECAAARAAGAAGTAYILSTISGHKLEDVKAASVGPVWYQLYLVGGRAAAEAALERAARAGFSVLAVTIDTGTAGMRERDIRNGTAQLMSGNVSGHASILIAISSAAGMAGCFSEGWRSAQTPQCGGARGWVGPRSNGTDRRKPRRWPIRS